MGCSSGFPLSDLLIVNLKWCQIDKWHHGFSTLTASGVYMKGVEQGEKRRISSLLPSLNAFHVNSHKISHSCLLNGESENAQLQQLRMYLDSHLLPRSFESPDWQPVWRSAQRTDLRRGHKYYPAQNTVLHTLAIPISLIAPLAWALSVIRANQGGCVGYKWIITW